MMTILIIDDEPSITKLLKSHIEEGIPETTCHIENDFSRSADLIASLRPDAIVLDLMEGNRSTIRPGEQYWENVWKETFRPIIIYTASDADLQPIVPPSHPFVLRIRKGSGTLAKVVDGLKEFAPAIRSMRELRNEIDAVIHTVLRDTVGGGHMPMDDPAYLLHAGRRRIAAMMDSPTITTRRDMKSWEQYLIPAIGNSPLTADLLRVSGARWDDPTAYRLILTPSCDLVKGRRNACFLTARCESVAQLVEKCQLSSKASRRKENINKIVAKALTRGEIAGLLPLPGFPGRLPNMAADLKGLEVISWDSVGSADPQGKSFDRIASIDSPFREQVAWSYLTIAARPGMPERDLESWAIELVNCLPQ